MRGGDSRKRPETDPQALDHGSVHLIWVSHGSRVVGDSRAGIQVGMSFASFLSGIPHHSYLLPSLSPFLTGRLISRHESFRRTSSIGNSFRILLILSRFPKPVY